MHDMVKLFALAAVALLVSGSTFMHFFALAASALLPCVKRFLWRKSKRQQKTEIR